MPKGLTGSVATEVSKVKASEPLIIVEVQWSPSETKFYCEENFGDAEALLETISTIETVTTVEGSGSSGSATCVLSDTSGYIKNILGTRDIHKVPVNIYLAYATLTFGEKVRIFTGELNTPIEWDDAARTFKFEIVTRVEDGEIGFSPEQAEAQLISESAVGKAWPLCFGSPLHVPAVRINEQPVGTALFRMSVVSAGTTTQLCNLAKQRRQYARIQSNVDSDVNLTTLDDAAYAAVLENLGSASTGLTQAVAAAVQAGASASTINNLISSCESLQDAETDLGFWRGQSAIANSNVEITQNAITSINSQIAAVTVELGNATDAGRIVSLNASLVSLNNSLTAANAALAGHQAALTQANANILAEESNVDTFSTEAANAEAALIRVNIPKIVVKGGEKFPQNEQLSIVVNGLVFAGSFNGEEFVTSEGVPLDPSTATPASNLEVTPGGSISAAIGQFSYAGDFPVQGMYSWQSNGLVYLGSQFDGVVSYTPALFRKTGQTIPTLSSGPRDVYADKQVSGIGVICPFVRPEWIAKLRQLDASGDLPAFASGLSNISYSNFTINVGDQVRLVTALPEVWIANLIPSTEIKEIMAYRSIDGNRKLVPVPESYYTIELDDDILGQSPTTITLKVPLSSRRDENWEDGLFVSLTSTIGPNTSDIMKWIAETYSDLSVDATSFASLASDLTDYPSHFALLDRRNTLTVLKEIAWQCRSALFIKNDTLYATYLAFEDTPVLTIDDDNTEFESLSLTITETEDLVTVFRSKWRTEYTEDQKEHVLRNNIPKYGTIEKSYDFYIYNIENLVVKSATFWMIRYSNSWKIAKLTTMFDTFNLDEFDIATIDFGENIFSSGPITGVVSSVSFDSDTMALVYEIWTSVRVGELTKYPFAWPANADPGLEYPTAADLFAGGAA
jgi:hypothetical protein